MTATPSVTIKSLQFSDGSTLEFSPSDLVVFVGPNNSGKSAALRDILHLIEKTTDPGIVVKKTETEISPISAEKVSSWVEKNSRTVPQRSKTDPIFGRLGFQISKSDVTNCWNRALGVNPHPRLGTGLTNLTRFFVCHLTTDERLNASNPPKNISLTEGTLTHPIHYLQVDDSVELRISGFFRDAFGEDLIVHRNAGNTVPLFCGQRPEVHAGEDRVSLSYVTRLEKLSALQDQGDGMRSFVGVLLHSLIVEHSIVMIDEPEAFLHPPQARILGRMLAAETPRTRQMFLATHSIDFLQGLLDADSDRVKVVRITRDGDINHVKVLDSTDINRVWADPILRYSNMLDGLFHGRVILCEGDSDCRFYAAIKDAITLEQHSEDVMFTHCGGKGRLPVAISSLRSIGIPVHVVADFDLLNSDNPLRRIWEALGGTWDEISSDWKAVKDAVDQKRPELNSDEVKKKIQEILQAVSGSAFPKDASRNIQSELKKATPWSVAKSVGRQYIPSGSSTQACNRLFCTMQKRGLFVVPVGEMEGFVKSEGGHGPKWVNSVLEAKTDLGSDSELKEARDFVTEILTAANHSRQE